MRKRDELTKVSCTTTAFDDEMVFVLLARDPAAPVAIRSWVDERLRLGKNVDTDRQITEAIECARTMDIERAAVRARVDADRDRCVSCGDALSTACATGVCTDTDPPPLRAGCAHPRVTDTLPSRCIACGEIVGRP